MDTKSNYRTAIFKGSIDLSALPTDPPTLPTDPLTLPTDLATDPPTLPTNLATDPPTNIDTSVYPHHSAPMATQPTGYPVDRSDSPSISDTKNTGVDMHIYADVPPQDEPRDITAFLFDTTTQMLASLQARILYLERRVDHLAIQLEDYTAMKKKIDALYDIAHRHECNIHAIRSAITKSR